jgi:hypothetical protein
MRAAVCVKKWCADEFWKRTRSSGEKDAVMHAVRAGGARGSGMRWQRLYNRGRGDDAGSWGRQRRRESARGARSRGRRHASQQRRVEGRRVKKCAWRAARGLRIASLSRGLKHHQGRCEDRQSSRRGDRRRQQRPRWGVEREEQQRAGGCRVSCVVQRSVVGGGGEAWEVHG